MYFFLNFAGAKMVTHPGRDNGTWQTEDADGEILRKVLLYLGNGRSHVKVRAIHPVQLFLLSVQRIDLPCSSLLLPSCFLPLVLPVVWKEGLCDPESLPNLQSWGSPGVIGSCHQKPNTGKAQGDGESLADGVIGTHEGRGSVVHRPLPVGISNASVIPLLKLFSSHLLTLPFSLWIPRASVHLFLLFRKETCPLSPTSHLSESHHLSWEIPDRCVVISYHTGRSSEIGFWWNPWLVLPIQVLAQTVQFPSITHSSLSTVTCPSCQHSFYYLFSPGPAKSLEQP